MLKNNKIKYVVLYYIYFLDRSTPLRLAHKLLRIYTQPKHTYINSFQQSIILIEYNIINV